MERKIIPQLPPELSLHYLACKRAHLKRGSCTTELLLAEACNHILQFEEGRIDPAIIDKIREEFPAYFPVINL